MTKTQLHYIFDGRDSQDDIKKYFHSITLTANYIIYTANYKKVEINYDKELVIAIDENDCKEYFDFVDINTVRERKKYKSSEIMQDIADKYLPI